MYSRILDFEERGCGRKDETKIGHVNRGFVRKIDQYRTDNGVRSWGGGRSTLTMEGGVWSETKGHDVLLIPPEDPNFSSLRNSFELSIGFSGFSNRHMYYSDKLSHLHLRVHTCLPETDMIMCTGPLIQHCTRSQRDNENPPSALQRTNSMRERIIDEYRSKIRTTVRRSNGGKPFT